MPVTIIIGVGKNLRLVYDGTEARKKQKAKDRMRVSNLPHSVVVHCAIICCLTWSCFPHLWVEGSSPSPVNPV